MENNFDITKIYMETNKKKIRFFNIFSIFLNKDKRLEAAIIPEKNIIGNSCNFISLYNTEDRESKQFYYWIFLNSSVAEWQFRAFSYNNHVSNNELAELHCIPFEDLGIELKLLLMSNQSLQNQEKEISGGELIISSSPIYCSRGLKRQKSILPFWAVTIARWNWILKSKIYLQDSNYLYHSERRNLNDECTHRGR